MPSTPTIYQSLMIYLFTVHPSPTPNKLHEIGNPALLTVLLPVPIAEPAWHLIQQILSNE